MDQHRGIPLREARQAAGLSLRAVALEAGWRDHSHLGQFERGDRRLTVAAEARILEAIAALQLARELEAPAGAAPLEAAE